MPATGATGAAASSADPSKLEFNCATCVANFETSDEKRTHMRDDWQSVAFQDREEQTDNRYSVYNLKRRIASLPPISSTVFHEQVLTSKAKDEEEASSSFQQTCEACEQHYTNRKTWKAHLKSRNHIQAAAEYESKASAVSDDGPSLETISPMLECLSVDEPEEEVSADEEEEFNSRQCLFCSTESTSLESNLKHMSHAHSFFIPDQEYLIDIESLLSYLTTIISVFHECLFCETSRNTTYAIQDHMRGKGHCKLDFENDEHQLREFYDFSGETEGEELEGVTLVPDEDELRLPSGKTLGHRSRARFFRQNHVERSTSASASQPRLTEGDPGAETEAAEPEPAVESKDRRVAMRAGTSTSLIGVPESQQRALIAVEKKMEKIEARARNEYQARVERGGNKQKHYRVRGAGKKQGGLEKVLG